MDLKVSQNTKHNNLNKVVSVVVVVADIQLLNSEDINLKLTSKIFRYIVYVKFQIYDKCST